MKVGLVLDDGLDRPDGVQQYVMTLGKWLSDNGHEVAYLCGETDRKDLNVKSLSKNVRVSFNRNRLTVPLPASNTKIKRTLMQEDFDVLHVQLPCSPWLAGRIIRQANPRTAVVGTFHIAPYSPAVVQGTKLLGLALKPAMRRFDTVMSVSEAAKDFASLTLKADSDVVPNMVDLGRLESGRPKHKKDVPLIVFLGRLVNRKGPHHLLEAINLLVHEYGVDFHLLVCGRGPMEYKLRRYVSKHGLEKYVTFVGFIDEKDKADYLASADIAIFPSTGGESFGIVLIEAMAAGAGAVIGGNNPGYTTVLGGIPESLVDPTNAGALAYQLKQFLENEEARKQIGVQQAEHVKRFDVHTVGKEIFSKYQEAIAKRADKHHNKVK